jgi:hypothetical protein
VGQLNLIKEVTRLMEESVRINEEMQNAPFEKLIDLMYQSGVVRGEINQLTKQVEAQREQNNSSN